METIKLKPSHIDMLFDDGDILSRTFHNSYIKRLYGPKFTKALENIKKEITPDTLVEIVSGYDSLCDQGCPYSDPCKRGDYEAVYKEMGQKLSPLLFSSRFLKGLMINMTPNITDTKSIEKRGFKVGEKYKLSELRDVW